MKSRSSVSNHFLRSFHTNPSRIPLRLGPSDRQRQGRCNQEEEEEGLAEEEEEEGRAVRHSAPLS